MEFNHTSIHWSYGGSTSCTHNSIIFFSIGAVLFFGTIVIWVVICCKRRRTRHQVAVSEHPSELERQTVMATKSTGKEQSGEYIEVDDNLDTGMEEYEVVDPGLHVPGIQDDIYESYDHDARMSSAITSSDSPIPRLPVRTKMQIPENKGTTSEDKEQKDDAEQKTNLSSATGNDDKDNIHTQQRDDDNDTDTEHEFALTYETPQ